MKIPPFVDVAPVFGYSGKPYAKFRIRTPHQVSLIDPGIRYAPNAPSIERCAPFQLLEAINTYSASPCL